MVSRTLVDHRFGQVFNLVDAPTIIANALGSVDADQDNGTAPHGAARTRWIDEDTSYGMVCDHQNL
jgi:hypothetical protein